MAGVGLAPSGVGGMLSALGAPKIDTAGAAKNSFSNRFGEIGNVAGNRARTAFDNLGNTAGARLASANLNNLGSAALGGVQSTSDSAARAALSQFGNTRRSAFDAVRNSGGGPGSIAGILAQMNEGNNQVLGNLSSQNSDNLSRAMSLASNNFSQGQSILQNDLGQQTNIAQTQLADFNPAMFQSSLDQQSQPSAWQGFAQGLGTATSSLGARLVGGSLSGTSASQAMANAQKNVLDFSPEGTKSWLEEMMKRKGG